MKLVTQVLRTCKALDSQDKYTLNILFIWIMRNHAPLSPCHLKRELHFVEVFVISNFCFIWNENQLVCNSADELDLRTLYHQSKATHDY